MRSIITLSQTNQLFHRLSDPTDPARRLLLEDYLIDAQAFTRWQGRGFACFSCTKVLFHDSFASPHTKGKRGLNGTQQRARFCIQCGVEKGMYSPGTQIVQRDVIRMVCRQCKRLQGGRFCRRCVFCEDCERRRQRRYRHAMVTACEGNPGHEIIGSKPAGKEIPERSSVYPVTALDLAWRMAEHEAETGEVASPEWSDGPDDIEM